MFKRGPGGLVTACQRLAWAKSYLPRPLNDRPAPLEILPRSAEGGGDIHEQLAVLLTARKTAEQRDPYSAWLGHSAAAPAYIHARIEGGWQTTIDHEITTLVAPLAQGRDMAWLHAHIRRLKAMSARHLSILDILGLPSVENFVIYILELSAEEVQCGADEMRDQKLERRKEEKKFVQMLHGCCIEIAKRKRALVLKAEGVNKRSRDDGSAVNSGGDADDARKAAIRQKIAELKNELQAEEAKLLDA